MLMRGYFLATLLLLSSPAFAQQNMGASCDTTITAGGTAQLACGGRTPTNGFEVCSADATSDIWLSDSVTAAVNGVGSWRAVANGGCYKSNSGYKPVGPLSIFSATTGAKATIRSW